MLLVKTDYVFQLLGSFTLKVCYGHCGGWEPYWSCSLVLVMNSSSRYPPSFLICLNIVYILHQLGFKGIIKLLFLSWNPCCWHVRTGMLLMKSSWKIWGSSSTRLKSCWLTMHWLTIQELLGLQSNTTWSRWSYKIFTRRLEMVNH